MNKYLIIIIAIIIFLAGGLAGYAVTNYFLQSNKTPTNKGMDISMEDMANYLRGKSGDELDKTFLYVMIIHHQTAVYMADFIKDKTQREDLKKMADDIISSQTKEILQMRQWQESWFK